MISLQGDIVVRGSRKRETQTKRTFSIGRGETGTKMLRNGLRGLKQTEAREGSHEKCMTIEILTTHAM